MEQQPEAPGVKNKGLLVTALILGVVVVLVYNWHINQVRQAGIGETVRMLAPKRSMEAGEKLEVSDLKVISVETNFKDGLGSNFIFNTRPEELKDEELSRRVQRGRFLRWDDILGHGTLSPAENLSKGMESFQISIEPRESPGQMLRVGDRVVLMGVLAPPGMPVTTYTIIKGVKVVSIGGMAGDTGGSRAGARSGYTRVMRSYRTLGIEVRPETAVALSNIMTHLLGQLRVDVISHKNKSDYVKKKILVLPELSKLMASEAKYGAPG